MTSKALRLLGAEPCGSWKSAEEKPIPIASFRFAPEVSTSGCPWHAR